MLTLMLSIILSFSFLIYHSIRFKIPDSLSGMVYDMKYRWVWSIWMAVISWLLLPSLLDAMPDEWQFLGFLTVISLGVVAVNPLVSGQKNTLHYIFGCIAGILTQIDVLIIDSRCLCLWMLSPLCLIFRKYYVLIIALICWTGLVCCLV